MEGITFVVGLPGSGKTTWANHHRRLDEAIIDDPKDFRAILDICDQNKYVMIVDPWLCTRNSQENARKTFENKTKKLRWVFFENDSKQCKINARGRDKRVEHDIDYFSKRYYIPSDSFVIPVYR